jgi:hypothetical protein
MQLGFLKSNVCKYFDKVKMCFRTYLEAGGRYSQHKHTCQEITKVIKGHLIELLDNNKIYEVGQTVIYDSATMHEPYCTIESEYDVTFCYNLKPRKMKGISEESFKSAARELQCEIELIKAVDAKESRGFKKWRCKILF